MKRSNLIFDCVNLLYYKCQDINLNCDSSYIDSSHWIENKKATINLLNINDNKYFQYVVTITLNREEIKKDSQRISKLKPNKVDVKSNCWIVSLNFFHSSFPDG